jgi:hypothetical protein
VSASESVQFGDGRANLVQGPKAAQQAFESIYGGVKATPKHP